MEFEYDPRKSVQNTVKHGLDFEAAKALWQDRARVEVPARTLGESRSMVIGRIGRQVWSAIVTEREGRLRIISVRRARPQEVAIYEQGQPSADGGV